jgi:hypothetical protein
MLERKEYLEDLDIDGRIIFKQILKKGCQCVDWIHLVEDRVQWRAPMNPTINLQGSIEARDLLTS